MKLTADTISDAQIRAMMADSDDRTRRLCKVALNHAGKSLRAVADARAYCANLLNARAIKS